MSSRLAGSIRTIRSHRAGFDSYLANVQKPKCALSPSYDEARKDFDKRLRGEVRGLLG